MGWRPRPLLNENKCSTWARLCGHVSPPRALALWVPSLGPSTTLRTPQVPVPTVTEDFPLRFDPFPLPFLPHRPTASDSLELAGTTGRRKEERRSSFRGQAYHSCRG